MNNFNSYQEVLNQKGFIIVNITGRSMLPLLKEKRNTVLLVKPSRPIRKRDVLLYQRENGSFILHRVLKIKNNVFTMCGDNNWELEYNIKKNQIIGLMEGYYRGEKYISIEKIKYRIFSFFHTKFRWCRWSRDCIKRILRKIKRIFIKE